MVRNKQTNKVITVESLKRTPLLAFHRILDKNIFSVAMWKQKEDEKLFSTAIFTFT